MEIDTEQNRELFFEANKPRLQAIAFRAVHELGKSARDIVVLCIDVDDPAWTEFVDFLMPNFNWQQIRDRGEKPVARGWKPADPMIKLIGEAVPAIKDALHVINTKGEVTTIVMSNGGTTVHFLEPKQQKSLK